MITESELTRRWVTDILVQWSGLRSRMTRASEREVRSYPGAVSVSRTQSCRTTIRTWRYSSPKTWLRAEAPAGAKLQPMGASSIGRRTPSASVHGGLCELRSSTGTGWWDFSTSQTVSGVFKHIHLGSGVVAADTGDKGLLPRAPLAQHGWQESVISACGDIHAWRAVYYWFIYASRGQNADRAI